MNSSIYGTVVFDLILFNEVARSDYVIRDIKASVIDSCIELIIGIHGRRVRRQYSQGAHKTSHQGGHGQP